MGELKSLSDQVSTLQIDALRSAARYCKQLDAADTHYVLYRCIEGWTAHQRTEIGSRSLWIALEAAQHRSRPQELGSCNHLKDDLFVLFDSVDLSV